MNIVSILIGLVLLVFVLVGLIPLLGWLNWIALLIGAVGVLIGALSRHKAGMIFNIVLLAIAILRLSLGGGIL
ncbi:hypothetical protein FPZ24_03445 [Sphingomonas panacisoli]|uniref:Major facilitator superfamily (MFS) profile domain-containing protein n=1 Tax=Sphingomonas panacisoli TaxID=1813879 RepID=A0A5B8LEZ2_9SPHN|nr:hypothetical protein [Sphingomonas panacisoli]QDZ06643.1 hypothetical protein FPZ24_03445 [Sphingomonas panacisoli]